MFMGFLTLVLVALALACGGDLRRLATVRLRGMAWIWGALALQILVISIVPSTTVRINLNAVAHVATYAVAGAIVWANRRIPGVVLIGIGAGLNALAITANGGTLPASSTAVATAGVHTRDGQFRNSGALTHAHLAWLGDRFASPSWLPFRNVFSIGDVVIILGAVVLLSCVCRPRRLHALLRAVTGWDTPAASPGRHDGALPAVPVGHVPPGSVSTDGGTDAGNGEADVAAEVPAPRSATSGALVPCRMCDALIPLGSLAAVASRTPAARCPVCGALRRLDSPMLSALAGD